MKIDIDGAELRAMQRVTETIAVCEKIANELQAIGQKLAAGAKEGEHESDDWYNSTEIFTRLEQAVIKVREARQHFADLMLKRNAEKEKENAN